MQKSAYWDSPYFEQAVKNQSQTHTSQLTWRFDNLYVMSKSHSQMHTFLLTWTVCTCYGLEKNHSKTETYQLTGTVHNLYALSKNHSQTHTFQLTGTVRTFKHTHFSLWGESVICMGCQNITNRHILAYWDSLYFVWAVKKSH